MISDEIDFEVSMTQHGGFRFKFKNIDTSTDEKSIADVIRDDMMPTIDIPVRKGSFFLIFPLSRRLFRQRWFTVR